MKPTTGHIPRTPKVHKRDGAGRVVVGYCHPTEVSAFFHESLLALVMYDVNHNQRVVNGGGRIERYSSANITNSRNGIVRSFLDDTTAEWLLFLDSDMKFEPDLADRLVEAACDHGAPIVGALCFGTDQGSLFATLYQMVQEPGDEFPHMVRYNAWPEDEMFEVTATGAACLLIHRTVLESMREKYPEPYPWFQETVLGTGPMGEDVTFCVRARLQGFPVFVHTGIHVGHAKTTVLTHEMYSKQRALEAMDGTRDHGPGEGSPEHPGGDDDVRH